MRNILVALTLAGLFAIILTATNTSTPGAEPSPEAREAVVSAHTFEDPSYTAPAADAGPLPESSVYQVESEWTDQRGERVPWPSLQGQVRLVALFFTHCGYACPRIVHELKGLLSEGPGDQRRAVGVVLVSIDPEHDTPEALRSFSKTHGLEFPQWTLLTGADPDVREIAAVLGARFKQQQSGEFAHSNSIILLDERGEIAARRDGFDQDRDELIAALRNHR